GLAWKGLANPLLSQLSDINESSTRWLNVNVKYNGKKKTLDDPPEGMLKELNAEWMSTDEDIPKAATLTNLEFCQAVCEKDEAINVDDSDGDKCAEENPPKHAEMRQTLDILKRGVQHRIKK
ncbi:hypothetical protein AVEN_184116-2-1, partial [Araneus ventricosus]